MIRPTNSYFVFSPSVSFDLNSMLTLTFTATSRNDVIFRYFQGAYNYDVTIPGETNLFKDLAYSFDFGNIEHRQSTGFKLKSLALALTHDLHDWNLKCEFKLEPKLITDTIPYRYDFSPYFTIAVVWKPMNNFKAEIKDEYGEWTLNPATTSN